MGRRPTQGDEKRLSCSNCSPWARYPPPCHPERSRGTCGSADLSGKCFSTERTRISYFALLTTSTCVALRRETRMQLINATKLHRKSGVPEWSDLQFRSKSNAVTPGKWI